MSEFPLFQAQAELRRYGHTHADLLQEPHEARRRHDADFPHESLCYRQAPLLLAAALRVRLPREEWNISFLLKEMLTGVRMCCFYLLPYFKRVKVGACQQVLQVEVALWLRLFQHDHGVCLSEERASCSHLPHLNQLHDDLWRNSAGVTNFSGGDKMHIVPQTTLYLLIEIDESAVR